MAGKELTLEHTRRIGVALCRQHPEVDPDNVPLEDVHRLTAALPEFTGDPGDLDENALEAIRSAWSMEFLDRTQ